MKKPEWLFIANPQAGSGKVRTKINTLLKILKKENFDYDFVLTEKEKHATELAEEYINNGVKNIVAVGGDGTIHEVATGIIKSGKTDLKLGIIPIGSGNDFVKNFNIPKDLRKAIKLLKNKNISPIDVGQIENFYFINTLGIGFDAEVSKIAHDKVKWIRGILRYLIAAFWGLIRFKSYPIEIEFNNNVSIDSYTMISVGNGRYCGGGYKLTPNANLEDGQFDLCLVKKLSRIQILKFMPSAVKGTHITNKFVKMNRTDSLTVKSDSALPVYIDGEIPKLKNPFNISITIIPKALNVLT